MIAVPQSFVVYLVLTSAALASTLCNESSLLSAGNAYHFTNCLNVSFPSIPSNNLALVVEDSTVFVLSLDTLQLSVTNVTLRFMRCTILCDLSLSGGVTSGLMVNGFTVELISCKITFDTVALYNADRPAVFLDLTEPQGIDNLWIRMANSWLNLTGSIYVMPGEQGNLGFLRIYRSARVSQLHNISVIIEDSRIDLLYAFLEESDEVAAVSDPRSSLLCCAVYRQNNGIFASSISDMYLSLTNITGKIQAPMENSLVTLEGILNRLSIHVSNVTFQMASYGPYSNRSMQRLGVLVLLSDSPCNGCILDIADSHLHFSSVAGSLTQVESATMMRLVTCAFVVISVPWSAISADGTMLPSLPSTITLRNCHLVTYNIGGQFSYLRGGIRSMLVEVAASSKLNKIVITKSTLNVSISVACPYHRKVRFSIDSPLPYVNTSSVALNMLVSLVFLAVPAVDVTVTVVNSSVSANVTTLEHCSASTDGSIAVVSPGFTTPLGFATTVTIFVSSTTCADESLAMAIALRAFSSFTSQLASGTPATETMVVANTTIVVVGGVIRTVDFSGGNGVTLVSSNTVQLAKLLAHTVSYGGQWNKCSVDVAQTQLHTPAIAFSSSVLHDTSISVSGESGNAALATWLSNGTQDAVTSVYLSNVSCGAGCGTSSITVRDFPLPVDVVGRGSGGGLVALLNGSDALLSGVAWRFSDIHVRVRRRRSVPFVLFDANVATVNDPLVDVSLSCVSWNGLRTVPLVGPPLARMYQDSAVPAGCVFPAAPTFSQTFVAPVAQSVTKAVSLSGAISVVSYAVVAVSGAGSVAALQQAVSQHASMRRMCAAEMSSGDQVDSPPLMSSYIDNPLQVRIASFGPEMEYVGGSIVGNLCFVVVLLVVKLFVTSLVCAFESGTSFDPAALLKVLLSRRFGLPGVAWAPFCAMYEVMITASVAGCASCPRSEGIGLLSISSSFLVLSTVTNTALFLVPVAVRRVPVSSVRRCRSLRATPMDELLGAVTQRLDAILSARWQWRAARAEARRHKAAPEHSHAEGSRFMDRYEELLSVYCRGRHWFFAVEAAVSLASGVVNGLSMGLRPDVVCGAQWAFSAALLLLLACLLVAVVTLQPYNVRADAVVAVGSALLSAASIVVLMVSAAGDRLADVVGAILMVQSLVGMLSVASLAHRIVASALRLKLVISSSSCNVLLNRPKVQSSESALRSLVVLICNRRRSQGHFLYQPHPVMDLNGARRPNL